MREQLEDIRLNAAKSLNMARSMTEIDDLRLRFLGRKGELTSIIKQLDSLTDEERPVMGKLANEIREFIESLVSSKTSEIGQQLLREQLGAEKLDVTLPGTLPEMGRRHPLQQMMDDIRLIFLGMGFDVIESPQVEYATNQFDLLNIPLTHPSRDEQDTFYTRADVVLRRQTAPVQIRAMMDRRPPIRVLAPGRVYRRDTADAIHSPVYHQIEGLVVDRGIRLSDLKGTLESFIKKLYGADALVRFRPHHSPFTEPSAVMDIPCFACQGQGCPLCHGEGILEIIRCGMVHPKVLENCNIDPQFFTGFSFGMELDRLTMLRYGIDDIQLLFQNDMRFLRQF